MVLKGFVDEKWEWREQGGMGYILTLNKLAAHKGSSTPSWPAIP